MEFEKRTNILLVLLLILVLAKTTVFSLNIFVGPLLLFFISLIIFISRKIVFDKVLTHIILIVISYFIIIFFYFGKINISYSINILFRIVTAYLIIKILGFKLFEIIFEITYWFSLLAFPFYLIQLINGDLLFTLIKKINDNFPVIFNKAETMASLIFYTIKSNALKRNSGFMWEPGAYAAILALALIFGLTKNHFIINKKIIILFISLLTTLSSMGLLILIVVGLYYLLNTKYVKFYPLIIVILPFIIILILTQDIVSTKIISEIDNIDNVIFLAYDTSRFEFISLGRLGSLKMDILDWTNYPIFGHGGNLDMLSQSSNQFVVINRTNGLSFYLITFGLAGFIFMLYNLKKTFSIYCNYYNAKGSIIIVLAILTLTFSNSILDSIFLFSFQFFHIVYKSSDYANK